MPAFSVLAPIVGSVLGSAADNTNRRDQFNAGAAQNAFSIFTGGPQVDLSGLQKNNSFKTVLQGVTRGIAENDRLKAKAAADAKAVAQNNQVIDSTNSNSNLLQNIFGGQGITQNLGAPQAGFSQLAQLGLLG
jgi:hypothetical protein